MGYYPGQARRAPRADAKIADERKERRKKGEENNNKIYLQGATVTFIYMKVYCSKFRGSF
jgi:hypothetical protein